MIDPAITQDLSSVLQGHDPRSDCPGSVPGSRYDRGIGGGDPAQSEYIIKLHTTGRIMDVDFSAFFNGSRRSCVSFPIGQRRHNPSAATYDQLYLQEGTMLPPAGLQMSSMYHSI